MTTPHRQKDIERFEQWSGTYEQSGMQQALFEQVHQAALALAADLVPHPGSVLDVGCGTGKLLRRARTCWPEAHLIGVDPANGMIEMAKRLTPSATFFTGKASALPLDDASVEVALFTSSFHHWQDQAASLRENARVLKPGVYLLLVDMSFPDWLVRLLRLKRVHSRARLQALFKQAGLQVQMQHPIARRRGLAMGHRGLAIGRGGLVTVGKK